MTPAGPINHQSFSSTNIINPNTGFVRIKIYQRQTDDLIAIRAPTVVQLQEPLQHIQECVGTNVRSICFRDESGAGYFTGGSTPLNANNGARLIIIDNVGDPDCWIGCGNRLVLYVD
ncbi:hypothetical protein PtB15_4B156 [Puccinia triticina]|nr:hypothetical protein PtB15_4B156 [Puccinia triticina]